LLESRVIRS